MRLREVQLRPDVRIVLKPPPDEYNRLNAEERMSIMRPTTVLQAPRYELSFDPATRLVTVRLGKTMKLVPDTAVASMEPLLDGAQAPALPKPAPSADAEIDKLLAQAGGLATAAAPAPKRRRQRAVDPNANGAT